MSAPPAILTYHSLDDSGSVISISPRVFRAQMQSLAAARIPVVPLERILESPGSVAITFDDGFRNLTEHAFPILDRLGFAATVFVVSEYAGRSNGWPSQPGGVPILPLLDWNELSDRPTGIAIGAHTATHPHLTDLAPDARERELRESRDAIADRLGVRPSTFAYPYGSVSPDVIASASRTFTLAVGTHLGFTRRASNPFCLPRLDMFYLRERESLAGLFSPATRAWICLRSAARIARQRLAA